MEWHTVKNFPDYEITETGLVRHKKNKKIKKMHINDSGYLVLSLNRNGKPYGRRIHYLLMSTFVDNPLNLPHVNHKNGNKIDNGFENLEWCTIKQNNQHAFKNLLINNTGEKNGMAKLTVQKVCKIKQYLKNGLLSQYEIAKIYGVSRSCILGIKLGRLWKHVTNI